MKAFGNALIILGLLLMIFDLSGCSSDRSSTLTDWMDNWGKSASWAIKIGTVALGFILVAVSNRKIK